MSSLFGAHVDWGSLKVLSKNHPAGTNLAIWLQSPSTTYITFSDLKGRKITPCPITGLAARYLDPATGIPYANLHAYQTIQGLLNHRFVWSEAMGCYVGDEERTEGATGVPDGWEDAVTGK